METLHFAMEELRAQTTQLREQAQQAQHAQRAAEEARDRAEGALQAARSDADKANAAALRHQEVRRGLGRRGAEVGRARERRANHHAEAPGGEPRPWASSGAGGLRWPGVGAGCGGRGCKRGTRHSLGWLAWGRPVGHGVC